MGITSLQSPKKACSLEMWGGIQWALVPPHHRKCLSQLPLRMFSSKCRVSLSEPVYLGVMRVCPARLGQRETFQTAERIPDLQVEAWWVSDPTECTFFHSSKLSPSLSCSFSLPYSTQSIKCGVVCLSPTRLPLELRRWKLSLLNTFQVFHTYLSTANIKN